MVRASRARRQVDERRPGRCPRAALVLALAFMVASCDDGSDLASSTAGAPSGPSVIIDTDLSRWWDDATAVGIANVLQNQGLLRVLAIVTDVPNAVAVAAIDAINTAYGNPDIPLGAMAGSGADTFDHGYTDSVIARLPNSVNHSDEVPEAVALYRELLARAPERSVTIVAIGAYTNLAGLLTSPADEMSDLPGRDLIAAKVDRLVIMDGLFPNGAPALTNQLIDLEAANTVITGDWPTPIAWVDGFPGINMMVGSSLCFDAADDHPMRIVYELLFACGPPTDGNWDAPTLLYAVGDSAGLFKELGQGGAAVLHESGGLVWAPSSERTEDVYVHLTDKQALQQRIEGLLTER